MLKLNIQLFADGKVTIETDLNDKGFKSGLDKMQSVAKTGFKAIATSVGVAAVAITGLVAKSVQAAGELEQQIGGTKAVFKDFAETVQDKAAKAFEKMGVSANDFMATANKMGALMQGSGIDIETSMELSTAAMQRAADVASIMGIDINSAMESIAGAAKGNFTMMDNLGVAMNATTLEAYALSQGITKAYNEMDNATKIGLAMNMFLEKTAYAEGNYVKENETFAGSLNTLKAAFKNFLSGAGGINDVTKALTSFGKILLKSIGEMAPAVVKGITELVRNVIPEIPKIIEELVPVVLEGAMALINSLVEIFPEFVKMVTDNLPMIIDAGVSMILALAKGITQNIKELIPSVINAIITVVNTLLDNVDQIVDAVIEMVETTSDALLDAVPLIIDKLPIIIEKLIMAITNNLPKFIAMGIEMDLKLAEGIIKAIPQLISKIPEIIISLVKGLANYAYKMVESGKELLLKLRDGITENLGRLAEKVKEIPGKIKDWVSEGFSKIKEIGSNIVSGIWEGISNGYDWICNKIKGWVGNLTDFIKKVLGISSPSKVMANEVGHWMAEGIGVGFENDLDNIYGDMQKAIDLETEKMSANVQTSGTYQMAMSGIPEFNLVDNSNNTTQLVVNGKVLAEVVNTENRNREVARA